MRSLNSFEKLVDCLSKLPSVGKKSAERMAYAILKMKDEDAKDFSNAILNLKNKIHQCPICGLYTENEKCEICSDNDRNEKTIIVISYPKDVYNFEKLGTFKGRYHVLGGNISALKGISIDDLNINTLIKRIKDNKVEELIIATEPTIEGETTALYIAKLLEKEKINITRLAYGLPMGANLDYTDSLTLTKAIEGRKKI